MSAWRAQYRTELTLSMRNGEQLLVSMFIPLGILVFFSKVEVFKVTATEPVQELAPAVLGLAVMSTSLVSLGISTGFDRFYGVLKRLGATPLGRGRWLAAKLAAVLTIEALQWAVLIPTGFLLGWTPTASGWPAAIVAAMVGTLAFGGLGMVLAGRLPGLANLAVCNGLYLVLMVTGDMVVRVERMPAALVNIARVLPAAPLSDVLVASLGRGKTHWSSWPVLVVWAIVTPALAARTFRWD